jgi:thiosulfate/3-mercaptopyruvate sulfurtransferase
LLIQPCKGFPWSSRNGFLGHAQPRGIHGAGEGHGKPPPRPGHIAGAAHLDWIELIDPEAKTFKTAAELRTLLESKGITPDREVNTYCGGGRRGSIGTIVLKILGYKNARSYAAGFSQWSRQSDTPVES